MQHPIVYFLFMDVMFATFMRVKIGKFLVSAILLGGLTLLAALIVMGVFIKKLLTDETSAMTRTIVVSILLAYCLLFCLNTAMGRICLGIGAAQGSRYSSYLVLGFFAVLFGCLVRQQQSLAHHLRVCGLRVDDADSAPVNTVDDLTMREYRQKRRGWRHCYLARHDIQQCDALTQFQILPRSDTAELKEKRLQEKLDFLERNHLKLFFDRDRDQ
jgi:hypothetical protein